MKKKILIPIIILSLLIIGLILFLIIKQLIWNYKVEHAEKRVILNNTKLHVFEKVKVKTLIEEINGKLTTNPTIDTTKIGKHIVKFKYTTDEGYPVDYNIEVEVVDEEPPIITYNNKTVEVGYKDDIEKELLCGDNYDSNPTCILEGEYNLNEVGTYNVRFTGIDSSNNQTTSNIKIIVTEKSNSSNDNNSTYTDISNIIENYKTNNTKIGIDVSHWEEDINFKKVKEAGVEFVYIRVGRGNGVGKDYIEDRKFKRNIEGFNKVGIPVGIYFYSNANSINDAKKEVKWIVNKIKKYKVDLELVFDWENWDYFQEYDLSFYTLTETANAFIKETEKYGYKGMLYSSKYYLENMWFKIDTPVWLAHYTKQTNYKGKYKVWQICEDGKVDGIDNDVDIDIMYI